jgi:hypothetical protein
MGKLEEASVSSGQESALRPRDRFPFWPIFGVGLLLAMSLAVRTFREIRLAWMLLDWTIGLALRVGLLAVIGWLAIRAARRRLWREALGLAILPSFLLAAFLFHTLYDTRMQRAADPIAFRFERWMLDRERSRRTREERLLVVRCTDGFGGLSFGVAYDETDEILLPPGHQSETWKARARGTELGLDRWCAERIQGHYFRWARS